MNFNSKMLNVATSAVQWHMLLFNLLSLVNLVSTQSSADIFMCQERHSPNWLGL